MDRYQIVRMPIDLCGDENGGFLIVDTSTSNGYQPICRVIDLANAVTIRDLLNAA